MARQIERGLEVSPASQDVRLQVQTLLGLKNILKGMVRLPWRIAV